MTQTRLVVIIYIIGILIGAFFFDLWGAETSAVKSLAAMFWTCLLYTSPSPRDLRLSRMPSSA